MQIAPADSQSSRKASLQPVFMGASSLLVKRLCPAHKVDELVFSMPPNDWASNDGSVYVFLGW